MLISRMLRQRVVKYVVQYSVTKAGNNNTYDVHPGHTSTTTTKIACEVCGKTFNRDSRLTAHRRTAIPTSCEICNAVFCNSTEKRQHAIRQHSSQSIDAPPTTSNEHPVDESVPILGNTTYQNRQRYKKMISQHREAIRTHTINKRNWKKVNKELSASFNYGDLKQILHDVMRNETGAFRINLGFGSMLYHPIDKVYRYFYVSANQYLFDKAYTVSNHTDMTDFYNKIVALDIANQYYLNRPSSGWVVASLPNLEIKIMRIHGVPIGAGVELPGYIKRSQSIIGLTHHKKERHEYNDNLCLFRCLALHRGQYVATTGLKTQLEVATEKSYDEGVKVDQLGDVEDTFNIAVNVYSLQADKSAKVIRISEKQVPNVMYLNLYENHFSYISKFKSYAKKYQCPSCFRFITQPQGLTRHMKTCQIEIEDVYVGGKYRAKKTVFEMLSDIGIIVPADDRFDEFFTTFDFEALQCKFDEDKAERGRTFHYKHVPATVSICSSVPEHTEPVHIRSDGDPQELVDNFVKNLLNIQKTREKLLTE